MWLSGTDEGDAGPPHWAADSLAMTAGSPLEPRESDMIEES